MNGLIVAVFASIVTYLYPLISAEDFAFTQIDISILVRVVFGAVVGYLGKNFLTAENGKIGGVI